MGIENVRLKILEWKFGFWNILENFQQEFFFFFGLTKSTQFDSVDSTLAEFKCVRAEILAPHFLVSLFSFLLNLPSTFLPPLALFAFFFPLIFLLHLTISSHKKHFSKLLHLPSSISINISLDLCVLSIFITHPFLVKPIFQHPFSLHQNGFFLQGIFFSCFSW